MAEPQKRVMIWTTLRCMSTAFLRAMINMPGTKGLREPALDPHYFGSERVGSRFKDTAPKPGYTYAEYKRTCEKDYPGYDALFVKDMAYHVVQGRSTPAISTIPTGFIHTFLIRKPEKAIASCYKISLMDAVRKEGWTYFDPTEAGFKELYEMFLLVTERLGQKAIVVDADDLQKHPEAVLRKYCDAVGLSFHDQMLCWSSEPQFMEPFVINREWSAWWENAMNHNGFQERSLTATDVSSLPEDVIKAIKESQPFYDLMYQHRITID